MKLRILLISLSFFAITLTVLNTPALTFSGGPPAGVTGAPGEQTCAQCHSGAGLNAGPEQLSITFSGANNQYVPGQTYQVTVSFVSSRTRHGFQFAAKSGSGNGVNAGTIGVTNANTTQTTSSGGINYIEHTSSGTFQTSWTFNWTAPSVAVGNVTFYASGNAANNNSSSSGDNIYTTSRIITASTVQGLPVASVQKLNMEVYPNPAAEFIMLKSNELAGTLVDFQLHDMQGRTVFTHSVQGSDWSNDEAEIRLPEGLADGLYIAHLAGYKKSASQLLKITK